MPVPMGSRGYAKYKTVAEAAQMQHTSAAVEMIAAGHPVDVQDADGNTALHWAATHGLEELTESLLAAGARQDIPNSHGETPAHWAALSSQLGVLRLLADAAAGGSSGSDDGRAAVQALLTARNAEGFTPFLVSARQDDPLLMEWMFLKGVCVEERDAHGRTALQWASFLGYRRSVHWLLSRGASVARRDRNGTTALHWACAKGHDQIVKMLVHVGATALAFSPDMLGETPVRMALSQQNYRLALWLLHSCILQWILGRPYLTQDPLALLFASFALYNVAIYVTLLAPQMWDVCWALVGAWPIAMGISLVLWLLALSADPGWVSPRTIRPQRELLCQQVLDEFCPDAARNEFSPGGSCTSRLTLPRPLSPRTPSSPLRPSLLRMSSGATELQPLVRGRGREALASPTSSVSGETFQRPEVAEYEDRIIRGDFRQVCVICHKMRSMRTFHCKECGRCVQRLDHHCPWIDNCVGLRNQRSFYCFLLVLFLALSLICAMAGLFVDQAYQAFTAGGTFRTSDVLVFITLLLDVQFGLFVAVLIMRQTAYMLANVTTYEVMICPTHVQMRFPRRAAWFWYLRDCSFAHCWRRVRCYWALDPSSDEEDFSQAAAGGEESEEVATTECTTAMLTHAQLSCGDDTSCAGHGPGFVYMRANLEQGLASPDTAALGPSQWPHNRLPSTPDLPRIAEVSWSSEWGILGQGARGSEPWQLDTRSAAPL